MRIPFVDLEIQYKSIKFEIDSAIQNVINDSAFIKGKYVNQFEKEYAASYGVKQCVSCANGTDAIYITLKALGIGLGDEIITVANTWISTAETITQTGAKPIFVDIHPDYYTIDGSKIIEKITAKTKAIIPVHLYGQPAEMDQIIDICKQYNLLLVEDCAQAHFAEWKGNRVGTMGIAGTFSFFPGKNLGAFGDAGCIVTNNNKLAERARMFANHGAIKKHHHLIEGINSRMDGLQAAILSVKLPLILAWNEARYLCAFKYNELLKNIDELETPLIHADVKHVFHLYVIRAEQRDELQRYLQENGISTGIHYPQPLPFLKAYDYLKYKPSDFPIAYGHRTKILSLPMFAELNQKQIEFVVLKIKEFYNRKRQTE